MTDDKDALLAACKKYYKDLLLANKEAHNAYKFVSESQSLMFYIKAQEMRTVIEEIEELIAQEKEKKRCLLN